VTFTASARISTPRIIRSRAPAPNLTSLAAMCVSFSVSRSRRVPGSTPGGVGPAHRRIGEWGLRGSRGCRIPS
jgi:hypothetical protein